MTPGTRKATLASMIALGMMAAGCGTTQRTDGPMQAPDATGTNRVEGTDERIDRTGTVTTGEVEVREGVDRRDLEKDWGETAAERRAILKDLDDLHDRIEDRVKEVDRRMRRTEDQRQLDALRDYRLELERERARVADDIRNMEVAASEDVVTVGDRARNTARDVGAWFDRQGDRLERLFDGDDNDGSEMEIDD